MATVMVLAYHNIHIEPVEIKLRKRLAKLPDGGEAWGWCRYGVGIEVKRTVTAEQTATVIVHEIIHWAFGRFGEGTTEYTTSTLVSKLKPEITPLASALLEGTYRRAAFIAHSREGMAYRNAEGEDDRYNSDQYDRTGVTDKYKRKGSAKQVPDLLGDLFKDGARKAS